MSAIEGACYLCGCTTELRPYGPEGQSICFVCAFSTPELIAQTHANFDQQLDAMVSLASIDPEVIVTIGNVDGPGLMNINDLEPPLDNG